MDMKPAVNQMVNYLGKRGKKAKPEAIVKAAGRTRTIDHFYDDQGEYLGAYLTVNGMILDTHSSEIIFGDAQSVTYQDNIGLFEAVKKHAVENEVSA